MVTRPGSGRWLAGTLAGFVGGLIAAGAMGLAHKGLSLIASEPKAAAGATSNGDDPTVKAAAAVLRRPLAEREKPKAATLVHYGFGATVGALYGAAAELAPVVTAGTGLPFGVAVWLGAHVIAVPALRLAPSPTRQPPAKEAEEFGLHLIYGLTTELARRLLRRMLPA